MEQLVWYSNKHNCFKSKFGSSILKNIDDKNGFDEDLVCVYELITPKDSFLINLRKSLKKLFKRKQKIVYVYIDKSRYPPWWKWKR